jgi:TRAP-type uncharacterized transport system fused permease subunit
VAAFAGAALAKADPMRTGYSAMRFGWTAFVVPFLFVASPTLILIGSPLAIIQSVATAFFGVWLVSIAVVGYFMRLLNWPARLLFALAGLLALIPSGVLGYGMFTDLAGIAVGILLLGYEIVHSRAHAVSGASHG